MSQRSWTSPEKRPYIKKKESKKEKEKRSLDNKSKRKEERK
jgi:hypothetical protein